MTKTKQEEHPHFIVESNTSLLHELLGRMEVKIAIKAGVAACISLYVGVGFAKMLDRPDSLVSGTWCVLSTFVVMQAHLGGTYRAAWIRFLGVLIGSLMGGLFTSLFGSNPLILGISVILTVLICSIFNLKDSIRIACLSLSIVMILWGLNPMISPWKFGLYRFLDSALGILIAVLVSHSLWPAEANQKMRLNISKTLHLLGRMFQLELDLKPPPKNFKRIHNKLMRDIHHLLEETRHVRKESELELLSNTRNLEDWDHLIDRLGNIFESIIALRTFHEHQIKKILDRELQKRLKKTMDKTLETFKDLSNRFKKLGVEKSPPNLRETAANLNEELTRFRMTRTTRGFDRQEVEHFFVFFYHLRSVIEKLLAIEDKIQAF